MCLNAVTPNCYETDVTNLHRWRQTSKADTEVGVYQCTGRETGLYKGHFIQMCRDCQTTAQKLTSITSMLWVMSRQLLHIWVAVGPWTVFPVVFQFYFEELQKI